MSIPSTLVAIESLAGKDDVWDISSLLLANWITNVKLANSWLTDVVAAKSITESRICRLSKPYRTVGFNLTTFNKESTTRAQSLMLRTGLAKSLVPLYPDVGHLVSDATSGTNFVIVDNATYKRYFANGRVVVCTPRQDPTVLSWEVGKITSTAASGNNTRVNLAANLASTWKAGSRIWPLLEVELILESRGAIITDDKLSGSLSFREISGNPGLPSLVSPGSVPGGWSVHTDGVPIFNVPLDWEGMSIGCTRRGNVSGVGVDVYNEVYGSSSLMTWDVSMTALSRARAWDVIKFFDSRAGRTFPFWFVSPMSDFKVTSISGTAITVQAIGPQLDWTWRPYLAFQGRDGTVQIRQVTGHSRSGSNDNLTINSSITYTTTTLRRCSVAKFSRFDTDELTETWINPACMKTGVSVVESTDKAVTTVWNDTAGCSSLMPNPEDAEEASPNFFKFRQARQCSDGAMIDAWLRVTDIPQFPFYIKTAGECVPNKCCYFVNDGPAKDSHGLLIDDFTEVSGCVACEDCDTPPCYDCDTPPCIDCSTCNHIANDLVGPDGCPTTKQIQISGLTGGSAVYNGTHTLTWDQPGHHWQKNDSALPPPNGPGGQIIVDMYCTTHGGGVYSWTVTTAVNDDATFWLFCDRIKPGTECCPPANGIVPVTGGNYSGTPVVKIL